MIHPVRQFTIAMLLSTAAGALMAQTSTSTTRGATGTAGATAAPTLGAAPTSSDEWQRMYRASKIIGTDVRNTRNEKIGDIKDLVFDRSGAISYAVVSTGGLLGIGDRLHAVPWDMIKTAQGQEHRVLDIDKNRLKSAPHFDPKEWPNVMDQQWGQNNRRFYQGGSSVTDQRSAPNGSTSSTAR